MSYAYILAEDVFDGDVSGIRVRWQASAITKLAASEADTLQTQPLLKALTENFLFLAAYRLGNTNVKILGPPHKFTKDSATGEIRQEEVEHVSAELSGGTGRRCNIHVYFDGQDWNTKTVRGESVILHKQKVPDAKLSTGWYPGASGSTTDTTSYASSSTAAAEPGFSAWEQRGDGSEGWQRYNYTTSQWEYS